MTRRTADPFYLGANPKAGSIILFMTIVETNNYNRLRSKKHVMNGLSRSIVIILLMFVFYIQTIPANPEQANSRLQLFHDQYPQSSVDYIYHLPILIVGNSELIAASSSGTGSVEDPLIIEGLNITTNAHGIRIFNTTLNLIIRNCFIRSENDTDGYGIYINNCKNITIQNTQILLKQVGIGVVYSESIKLNNVLIRYCADQGFYAHDSSHVSIQNCSFGGSDDYGVELLLVEDSIVSGSVFETSRVGLHIKLSNDIVVINNLLRMNEYGAILEMSIQCNLSTNNFENDGLQVIGNETYGYDHVIEGNLVNGLPLEYFRGLNNKRISCEGLGQAIFVLCENLTISGGIFSASSIGIQIRASHACIIQWMIISDQQEDAIQMSYSTNCTVQFVYLIQNNYGIWINNCEGIKVSSNIITDNNKSGIIILSSVNCIVESNRIGANRDGLEVYNSDFISVDFNSIEENSGYGVYLERTGGSIIHFNRILSNHLDGISIYESVAFVISENLIIDNLAGIFTGFVDQVKIIENHIFSNSANGIHLILADHLNISRNCISANRNGIRISHAATGILNNNNISMNDVWGVGLHDASNFEISFNRFFNNTIGLKLDDSAYDNIVFSNYFYFNSEHNAWDQGEHNIWDDEAGHGNIWDDATSDNYVVYGSAESVDHFPVVMNTSMNPTTSLTDDNGELSVIYTGSVAALLIGLIALIILYHRHHT